MTPNYWCTWATQNLTAKNRVISEKLAFAGDQGAVSGRNHLDEESVFGENGWINDFESVRKNMFFTFDDGWDIPGVGSPKVAFCRFGSLELNQERFPSFCGSPAERMKKLAAKVDSFGWGGTGLWIAAQDTRDNDDYTLSWKDMEKYWKERLLWSRDAGIKLWKVDWGQYGGDCFFREFLTGLAAEIAPELIVENACPCDALNGDADFKGRFAETNACYNSKKLLRFSTLLRTYDTIIPHTLCSTLDRVDALLHYGTKIHSRTLLCVEDTAYIAAGLGCSMGIMRSPRWTECQADAFMQRRKRSSEVERAVRFQQIAPAWNMETGSYESSLEVLTDVWKYEPGETWYSKVVGHEIHQSAPAVLARNTVLPEVRATGEKPYVLASKHANGTYAVSVIPRIGSSKEFFSPAADILLKEDLTSRKIGIFGNFSSIRIPVSGPVKVLGRDLADDKEFDLTTQCSIENGFVKIFGETAKKLCGNEEVAEPGILLNLTKERC